MNRNLRAAASVLLLLGAVAFPKSSFAQAYLTTVGNASFNTPLPVELGSVNAANGNLQIAIPLGGSFPQRGGRSYSMVLAYDSRIWLPFTTLSTSWQPINIFGSQWGGWRALPSIQAGGTTMYSHQQVICGGSGVQGDPYIRYTQYWNFSWTDPSGTMHVFPINTVYDPNGCYGDNPSDAEYANDSSGYFMTVNSYNSVASIKAADGTQVFPTYEDTNGNTFNNNQDTLGRTPVTVVNNCNGNSSQVCYVLLNAQGGTSTYTLNLTTIYVSTAFGQSGVTEYSGDITVPSSLQLPNSTQYTFSYDSYGELASIQLPTGGTISYTYTNFTDVFGQANRWVYTRVSTGNTWTYSPSSSSACGSGFTACQQVTETKPSGDQCVYAFGFMSGNSGAWLSAAYHYNGSVGGTPLETESATWTSGANYTQKLSQTVRLDTGVSSTVQYQYGSQFYSGDVTKISEWNSYTGGLPGTPTRITNISYASFTHPTSVTVTDGSGNTVAQTNTTYDSTGLTTVNGTANHDDSFSGARHNPTVIQQWTGSSWLTSSMTYDTTGQLRSVQDPNGNTMSFDYTDYFYDDNGANPPATHSGAPKTNAYLTELIQPILGGSLYIRYYYGTGQQAFTVDVNNQYTYSHFQDSFSRPTMTNFPDGGQSSISYIESSPPFGISYVTAINSSQNLVRTTVLDNLGRESQSQLNSDPQGVDYVQTSYDANGRVYYMTNPFRSTSDPTYGATYSFYDGLDRVTAIQQPDGAASTAHLYYGNSVASYGGTSSQLCSTGIGYPTLAVDESGHRRQSWTDGFGRLVEVDEPDGSNNMTLGTCYSYDLNNNLTGVNQGGQTRTYAYDALSRVTNLTTPESGTTSFTYDNNGNVHTRTDARNIITNYSYDALDRLTSKTYSDGTAGAYFYYDQTAPWTFNLSNPIGRLTELGTWSGSGWTTLGIQDYDAMGRLKDQWYGTPVNIGVSSWYQSYAHDLLGNLTSYTDGVGNTISQSFDTAGRVSAVTSSLDDSQHPATLAQGITYTPVNSPSQILLGNGLTDTRAYNNRLEPTQLHVYNPSTGADMMNHTLNFVDSNSHNNGNLMAWNSSDFFVFTRSYTYDNLNRLASMSSPGDSSGCTGLSWSYDRWGNRTAQSTTGGSCPNTSVSYSGGNNRMDGYGYDAAGNVTYDGVHNYGYDAENRMISVDAGVTSSDSYDALGKRVERVVSGNKTDYLYGPDGRVISEVNGSGTWQTGYVYLGGWLLAEYAGGTTCFVHSDHLGSTRRRTAVDGSGCEADDYLPFGDLYGPGAMQGTTHKFTGDELDSETGLYHTLFRQYSSTLGRWTSPDPLAGDPSDPQSLNRYNYVQNGCVSAIDPLGLDCGVIIAGSTQTPNTAAATAEENLHSQQKAQLAFPYSNLSLGQSRAEMYSQSEGRDTTATNVAYNSLMSAAQTPGKINVITFSAGASAFISAYQKLPADVKSRINNITYLSPAGDGQTIVKGTGTTSVYYGFEATEGVVKGVYGPDLNGVPVQDVDECGHDSNCMIQALNQKLKNSLGGPCNHPKVFTRSGGSAFGYYLEPIFQCGGGMESSCSLIGLRRVFY